MKIKNLLLAISAIVATLSTTSCEDNVSPIGSTIIKGDSSIAIDTLIQDLNAVAVATDRFDARSGYLLLGNLDVPQYGKLNCSFVSRLMSVASLPMADTIPAERVDSIKMFLGVASGSVVGDSLAPQQLKTYRLTKQLPSDLTNQFDPTGYYDPADVWGKKSYTVSNYGIPDNQTASSGVWIKVDLPDTFAKEIFKTYKDNPQVFQWPQTFAKDFLPGVFVESTFGKGCVSIISELHFLVYFHNPRVSTSTVDGESVSTVTQYRDSVLVFTKSPEVLSSNRVSYTVSDYIKDKIAAGETVLTTPGGYEAKFRFPAEELKECYHKQEHNLSIINSLTLSIPAESVTNDYDITTTPYLLMIKTSEVDSFFANNKVPDNKTSFYAPYDSTNKQYHFGGLRDYLLTIIDKDNLTDEDLDFSLIPVMITSETSGSYYYSTTYVTKCVPLSYIPTMTNLDTKNAKIVFTFSSQYIE